MYVYRQVGSPRLVGALRLGHGANSAKWAQRFWQVRCSLIFLRRPGFVSAPYLRGVAQETPKHLFHCSGQHPAWLDVNRLGGCGGVGAQEGRACNCRVGAHRQFRCNVGIRCNVGPSHASHVDQSTQQPGRPKRRPRSTWDASGPPPSTTPRPTAETIGQTNVYHV